ncbi:MAG: DotI/IcmL/TraM family protein [Gammaproteobacteria bacterium]
MIDNKSIPRTNAIKSASHYQGKGWFVSFSGLLLGLGLLICAYIIFFTDHQRNYAFFTTDEEPIRSNTVPSISFKPLARWATIAVTSAYTMNFLNLDQQLEQMRIYFTEAGYRLYLNTMVDQINNVRANKWDVLAIASTPGFILEEGEDPITGEKSWTAYVQTTVTTTTAGKAPVVSNRNIGVRINRTLQKNNSYGIAIVDFQIIPSGFLETFSQ